MILKSTRDYIHQVISEEITKRLTIKASKVAVDDLTTRVSSIENELRHRKNVALHKKIEDSPFPRVPPNNNWGPLGLVSELGPSSHRRVIVLPQRSVSIRDREEKVFFNIAIIGAVWSPRDTEDSKVTVFHGNKNWDTTLSELGTKYEYYYSVTSV